MRKNLLAIGLFSSIILFSGLVSEARVGGGGSFGSRGSRGVAPRSFSGSSSYYRPYQATPSAPVRPAPTPPPSFQPPPPYNGGGLLRNLMGGLAGGLLGNMLFRSMGYGGGMGMPMGGSGFGLLELLLAGGLAYFAIRMFWRRRGVGREPERMDSRDARMSAEDSSVPSFYGAQPSGAYAAGPSVYSPDNGLQSGLDAIRRFDGDFDAESFKEMCMDNFFNIQAAWMQRDLSPIKNLLTPEISKTLEDDLSRLKSLGRINRLENIAVRQTEVVEAWQEQGREYVTVRFHANLVDYTIDEKTGAVLAGSKNQPIKFEEFWTYAREIGTTATSAWVLSAIQQ